jgi:hypothetical protein
MKRIFKLLIFIAIIVSAGKPVLAERISKKVYHNFTPEKVDKLEVENKYGNIFIDENRTDSVIIDVDIWVEGLSENKAKKLLDKIDISVRLYGNTIIAKTDISNDFKTRQDFSIDYHISIPADRDLQIIQKYGHVVMNNLTGDGEFEIKYGSLSGKQLNSPKLKINIAYGKANIDEILDLTMELRYSKFFIEKGNNLNINSRYSTFDVGNTKSLIIESRYDHFDIESTESFQIESMYTSTKIGTLTKKLLFDNGYGNLKIRNVPSGFENINVENRYASVSIGIEDGASYYLKGTVNYCRLEHPDSNSINRRKENTSYEVDGYIGENKSAPSKVSINSKYGNVSLVR